MLNRLLLPAFLASLFQGCGRDEIQQYSVPKSKDSAVVKPDKVAAGPLTGSTNGWFFKVMGPTDDVLKQTLPFTQVIQSLQFSENGTPRYQVPEGWLVSNGPAPRYQTLSIPDTTPPLEVTISTLPVTGPDISKYLFANINRWRQQLGLEEMPEAKWQEEAMARGELIISPRSSRLVALINLKGTTAMVGPTRMLAAVVIDDPNSAKEMAGEKNSPVTFTEPEGWKRNAGNSMRLASLEAQAEGGVVDVSVSRFPGGGDVLANVNRWRSQVSLEPQTEEQLNAEKTAMKISGEEATFVEAYGAEQSILAAIVEDGDAKWFFKAQGPTAAIKAERDRFIKFLESAKLEMQSK
ncbi:hypothetical protein [Planctomicrobium sp. SH527]|uniref:hypothetical protein n=1 Tax=Planctomicrobium sp. SH527 TaxID=3448123 RepID=UPI003F5B9071